MKIIFVRHGQSESNVANRFSDEINASPLTEMGKEEAESTSEELQKLQNIDGIFTSPILRTRQTADIIAETLGKTPVVNDNLRERNMGRLNGLSFTSAEAIDKALLDEVKSGYSHGMEPWGTMKSRLQQFMESLPREGVFIAVSHRDPIAAALGVLAQKYDDDTISGFTLKIPHASITVVDPISKSIVSIGSKHLPDSKLID